MAPNKYTWFLVLGLIILALIVKPAYGTVGEIGQIQGSGVLEREGDIVIEGGAGVGVQSMDEAVTANGTMRIDFIDETRVELTEQSRLVIDEFVYDPETNDGKFVSNIKSGTVKVITGEISKKNPDNLEVNVTTGTIGARGTEFVVVAESNDENKIIEFEDIFKEHAETENPKKYKKVNIVGFKNLLESLKNKDEIFLILRWILILLNYQIKKLLISVESQKT